MILDAYLDRRLSGPGDNFAFCHVGDGTTPVAASQTALAHKVAATSTLQQSFSSASTYVPGPPSYIKDTQTYRFATGAAAGNLTEVGVGWSATALSARDLIRDGGGAPTTITVLDDEQLDVSFELRIYPPMADATGTVVLAGVTHNYTLRSARVGSGGYPFLWNPFGFENSNFIGSSAGNDFSYTGAIGALTSGPTGTATTATATRTPAAYVNGSFSRTVEYMYDTNSANSVGGIRSLQLCTSTDKFGNNQPVALFQVEFSPNIPKDATKRLKLNFTFTLGRGPVP